MLCDGKTGRSATVIFRRCHTLAITLQLPQPHRIDSAVVYLHRHNSNYNVREVRLEALKGGLWLPLDSKPGFWGPYDPARADFQIKLEGRGMLATTLRLIFITSGILSISEIQLFGAPAQPPAPSKPAPAPAALSVRQADADGDGKLDAILENRFVRLVISPAAGGVVRSFICHGTGAEMACAQDPNFGLLREQLWKPRYFFADIPASIQTGRSADEAWVETRITGAGGIMAFTHTRKRIIFRRGLPVVQVDWEIRNDPSSMTPYEYGPWMHNWVGTPGAVSHYFVPTVEGVQEFTLVPGKLPRQANIWYWQPARGWMAIVSEGPSGSAPTGVAFVAPYENLACFYHWAGISSPAATAEWRHGLVTLQPGQSFKATYLIVPFFGLPRVDGVVAAPGQRPWAVVIAIEAKRSGTAAAEVTVRAFNAGAPADLLCEASAREYPRGAEKLLARRRLGPPWPGGRAAGSPPRGVSLIYSGTLQASAPLLVTCRILQAGRLLGAAERLINFAGARVAYRLQPLKPRRVRLESEAAQPLPRHDLQPSVATPHVAWGRPFDRGPLKVLVLCDDQNAREVIELAQRLDVQFRYVKFRTTRQKEWIWQGDRSIPSLEAAQKRLLDELSRPIDVIVLAGFDWQVHFTPQIRAKLAQKVRAGTGLIAIEPCNVPADDPLAPALGISDKDRPLGRLWRWRKTSSHYIVRGLFWPWDAPAFAELLPPTRRMGYARPPKGQVIAAFDDNFPLFVVSRFGNGRVVAATYDVLTHTMSYRGFSALTPIVSYRGRPLTDELVKFTWPYWEHWWVLLTRAIVWAAGREPAAQIAHLSCSIDERGHVVARARVDGKSPAPLELVLQLADRYGAPVTGGREQPQLRWLAAGPWTAEQFRSAGREAFNLLNYACRAVPVEAGREVQVDLGPARAGWNFVRAVLRRRDTGAHVDWALAAARFDNPQLCVQSLAVPRGQDPMTDCELLIQPGQPWARIFRPRRPLELEVALAGRAGSGTWKLKVELADCHNRVLYRAELPVGASAKQVRVRAAPPELRNMGLEWRVWLVRQAPGGEQVVDFARRRFIALPPRVWKRFTFTSWSVNFLTRCLWLQPFLLPIAEELGIDVGMTSSTELLSGKAYWSKWHNIRHSYIGLLDYPGRGVPSFRDKRFSEKAAKYAQTRDKKFLVREPCLNDPQYRQKLAEALVERIKEAGRLGFSYDYCMGDEMSLTHYTRYFDYCFSPHCLARFREWLKRRYRSLDELNRTWQTDFSSWDEVVPLTLDEARKRRNAAAWGEFRTFMNDTLADFYAFVQRTIRSVDPQAKCGLSGTQAPKPGNGMDWWKLSSAFSYYHSYNTGWSNEMRRSFARETGVMQSPYYAGYWQSGRGLEYNMFWCLLHDTKGISCWTTPLLIYPDFTLTEAGQDTRKLIHELRSGLWDFVRAGERLGDGIAIHYSQASINAALLMDHDRHIEQVREAWVRLLEDLGLQYDFVSYEQIEKGELLRKPRRYRVLILPESIAISPREVEQIRRFVRAGGTVIADGWCALADHRCRFLGRPALDDMFGISRGREQKPASTMTLGAKLAGQPLTLRLRPAETNIAAATARAFGGTGGVPVLLRASVGRGQAWYLNIDLSSWPLDRTSRSPNEASVRRAIAAVLASAGVRPAVTISAKSGRPPHVEVVRYRIGRCTILGLLRDKSDRQDDVVTASWGTKLHVYDLRAHTYLGRRSSLSLPMSPGECRLLLLSPSRLPAPSVKLAARRISRGQAVRLQVAAAGRGPCPLPVRLTVIGPDGRELSDYSRNLLVGSRPISVAFTTALNDPTGRWRIVARCLASGRAAAAELEVH